MSLRHLPPLTWLRAFEASARLSSFTLAAQELGMSQAAVSKQVRLLEQHLAEPLFERRARSLMLTRVGADYLPKVHEAMERLASATAEVFGGRRAGALTVRAPAGFAVNWIATHLPAFWAAHPNVDLRLISAIWNEDGLSQPVHLDIRYGLGDWAGHRSWLLTRESATPVCAPALAKHLSEPRDLLGQRLLHVMGYEEGWVTWLKASGIDDRPVISGHFDTSLMALAVAAAGGGVALARRSMRGPEIDTGRVVAPFALDVQMREGFHLLEPSGGSSHPHAKLFRDWLLSLAEG